jgi:6-phosphogluconolactonase
MIQVYADLESLSQAAAHLFVERSRQAVRSEGRFSVALSGGHTPERTYQLLAQQPLRSQVPWPDVHVFWGDERCVPPDDPLSNARMARRTLLDQLPIPAAQIHPIPCTQNPRQAAEAYEALLRGFFADDPPRFSLVYLGLGENGHTASLFPGTPAVQERERWVVAVNLTEQGMWRITLTAPLINQAAAIAFLVAGATKAEVLRRVLEGPFEPESLPAQLIQPESGTPIWLVDRQAAKELEETDC